MRRPPLAAPLAALALAAAACAPATPGGRPAGGGEHTAAAPPPRIVDRPIPYGRERRAQMAAYSRRHYGEASWRLRPRAIVLHYTAGSTAQGAWALFAANTPNRGERPGTCAHFIVDKDGTILRLVRPTVRCRHTIGLNDSAIGIEMVQEAGPGSRWADRQILARRRQVGAAVALVRHLQRRFSIPAGRVIGHAGANRSPLFHDRLGWRNDHTDWLDADVRAFRRLLRRG